jgi:hypothetical protein
MGRDGFGGADDVRGDPFEVAALGAIPSKVLRRAVPGRGPTAGVDETRTAGGRDVGLGCSDTGRRSDTGLGSSDAGLGCSEDFGLSADVQASSMSSVGSPLILQHSLYQPRNGDAFGRPSMMTYTRFVAKTRNDYLTHFPPDATANRRRFGRT